MRQVSTKALVFPVIAFLLLTSCNPFVKPWNLIYDQQQELFNQKRQTFEHAAGFINKSIVYDTTLSINDKHLPFPDSLVQQLRDVGISEVTIHQHSCNTKDIRFIPDSLWDVDRFSVMEIKFDKCDERSRKGYHWKMNGSDHKHSFGQGDGWFIYSDSDRDPF